MKAFLIKHWQWVLLGVGALVAIALVFDLLGILYGAGLSVVAWFSTKQIARVRKESHAIKTKLKTIKARIKTEGDRQAQADEDVEAAAQAARGDVSDTWDDAASLPTPGLDD